MPNPSPCEGSAGRKIVKVTITLAPPAKLLKALVEVLLHTLPKFTKSVMFPTPRQRIPSGSLHCSVLIQYPDTYNLRLSATSDSCFHLKRVSRVSNKYLLSLFVPLSPRVQAGKFTIKPARLFDAVIQYSHQVSISWLQSFLYHDRGDKTLHRGRSQTVGVTLISI